MVKKYTCSNGVRIVLEEMPNVRSVAIGVWIGVGSRDETPENNGISHFIEHMLFKGTKTRTARDIAETFDSIGGQVNAFTSKEYTCYYAKVIDSHANLALDTLADMFFNSTYDQTELEKERNVVLEEIKMYEDTPDDIVHDMLSKAMYGNHSLGYPILGTEEHLHAFNSQTLKDYVNEMYQPDKIVISIAGNVNEQIIEDVEKLFGHYQAGTYTEQKNTPIFHSDFQVKKKETEQAHLCLGYEGLAIGSSNMYDLVILNNILGGSMSSRLFQDVREDKGLAYSVFSYHSAYKDAGNLTIYAGTGANQLEKLYETIKDSLDSVTRNGVTEKEVQNCKEQLKGSLMLGLESTNSRMSRNGKNELILKKHRSLDEIVESINKVNLEKVNSLAQSLFSAPFAVSLISPNQELPTSLKRLQNA